MFYINGLRALWEGGENVLSQCGAVRPIGEETCFFEWITSRKRFFAFNCSLCSPLAMFRKKKTGCCRSEVG